MTEALLFGFGGLLIAGMLTMLVSSMIAKQWLTANTGFQPNRVAAFFLGPILTSFGPVRTYTELRRAKGMPTTAATVFWVGTAVWGLGIAGFFVSIAALAR